MERLKNMKEMLVTCAQGQMGNLEQVNAQELGEVVDMIKDLDEAMYYCSVVKAMEEGEEEKKYARYAQHMMPQPQYNDYRDWEYQDGRMYYSEGGRRGYGSGGSGSSGGGSSSSGGSSSGGRSSGGNNARGGGTRGYGEYPLMYEYPREMRDYREGRSPISRRGYMESKENHQGKDTQMQELNKYLNELSQDISEMIQDASPEEKMLLQQKLNTLATKMK